MHEPVPRIPVHGIFPVPDPLLFHTVRSLRPNAPAIADVEAAVRASVQTLRPLLQDAPRGAKVAITGSSRGIARLSVVIRELCRAVHEQGLSPIIVPAMGSHGGATAEGQSRLLAHSGITEDRVHAPVVSSMEAVHVGTSAGIDVFMDRIAWETGRVIALNRVKPHTDFEGAVQSGLMKMIAVGLGKLDGATSFHGHALRLGYERAIIEMARCVLATGRILAGVGLLENDRHELCAIAAAPGSGLELLDRNLQTRAQELYPKLPFDSLDLLIVDELGKNISGGGMDAKVIGRSLDPDLAPANRERIRIRRIYIRDLTTESDGNAVGIGLADMMHSRIVSKIDFASLYTNARIGLALSLARMPMHMPNDRLAIELLIRTLGSPDPAQLRAAWVRNTLSIAAFHATPACAAELHRNPSYAISPGQPAGFDAAGNLLGQAPVPNP